MISESISRLLSSSPRLRFATFQLGLLSTCTLLAGEGHDLSEHTILLESGEGNVPWAVVYDTHMPEGEAYDAENRVAPRWIA